MGFIGIEVNHEDIFQVERLIKPWCRISWKALIIPKINIHEINAISNFFALI